ncbi:hypothetical protein EFE42_04745 [Methanohalophilus sp. RSK]|nr:hypothetical protein EFE42_04745 [Methanohalophilus sp. RSK]
MDDLDAGLLLRGLALFLMGFLWSLKSKIYFHIVYQITQHLAAIIKREFVFHRLNYYLMIGCPSAMRAICPNKHFTHQSKFGSLLS